MDVIVDRCAGLDVHKDIVVACVRGPAPGGGREQVLAEFATTTDQLLVLRDWLVAHGVQRVGMEATGVFWKPVFYLLEDATECWLLNPRHIKNVPGRKTDVKDAEWLAQLVECGLVRPSFVPPPPVRALRDLTRYRRAQIDERGREAQRLDKVLQDAGVKLSSVASDILGVSGRSMLAGLTEGTRDPAVLAELARGKLRAKIPALRRALVGRFDAHHALLVGEILAKLEFMDEQIARLSAAIHEAIGPFAAQRDLLVTVPGIDRVSAEEIIAEIGVDMSRFGSPARLASWAGVCPGQHESAGKTRSGKTRKGPKWLRATLHNTAKTAARGKTGYLPAHYHRIKSRRGASKALLAVGHTQLVMIWHMLDRGQPYHELGADYYLTRHDPQRHANRLVRQLQRLGYQVTISPQQQAA